MMAARLWFLWPASAVEILDVVAIGSATANAINGVKNIFKKVILNFLSLCRPA